MGSASLHNELVFRRGQVITVSSSASFWNPLQSNFLLSVLRRSLGFAGNWSTGRYALKAPCKRDLATRSDHALAWFRGSSRVNLLHFHLVQLTLSFCGDQGHSPWRFCQRLVIRIVRSNHLIHYVRCLRISAASRLVVCRLHWSRRLRASIFSNC